MKRMLIVLLLVTVALVGAGPARATTVAAARPVISGPALVSRSVQVTVSGLVQPFAQVQILFHRKGQPAGYFTVRRILTADPAGRYRTSYRADTDYAYFARSAGVASRVVLTQVRYLSISGPAGVPRGGTVRISGSALPAGSAVTLYFHRSTDPAGRYTLRRVLRSDAAGHWSASYLATADQRYFAKAAGLTSRSVLTQLSPSWLLAVNAYRAAFGVPAVLRNDALSAADAVHVRYMTLTGQLGHSEDPANRYYTATGNRAAGSSNVAMSTMRVVDPTWVDIWMTGPFHALGVLRPSLNSVGFASGTGSTYGSYAALDVLTDTGRPDPGHWPKTFPSAGHPFPFLTFPKDESPDPLLGCPAAFQQGPVSGALLVALGPDAGIVRSATARLVEAGTSRTARTCVQTETTYPEYPGNAILGEVHAIAVFAVGALKARTSYTLTVSPAGHPAVTVHFATR